VVGNQWFDEMPPHEIVTEQTTLDEVPNERRRAWEAGPSTTWRDGNIQIVTVIVIVIVLGIVTSAIVMGVVTGSEVVGRSYRKPAKNVDSQLVDEGSHSL
jgi:hypothetical protein